MKFQDIIEAVFMTGLAVALCLTTAEMGAGWGLMWVGGYWLMRAKQIIISESTPK